MQVTTPTSPRAASRRTHALDRSLDTALFKALGDPTRARLLACLAKCRRPCSVGEVAECCSVDLSVVSRHLAALARAGVLTPSRQGRVVRHALRAGEVARALRRLADAFESCAACGPATRACCGEGGCCGEVLPRHGEPRAGRARIRQSLKEAKQTRKDIP